MRLAITVTLFCIRFPAPSVPPMTALTGLLPSAFTIAIIAFAVSVSMSKIFAKKHNYEIDSNQVQIYCEIKCKV